MGLKELPDRESVREVLAGGHEPFEVDEGVYAWQAEAQVSSPVLLACMRVLHEAGVELVSGN